METTLRARSVVVGGGVMGVSIAMHLARQTDPLSEPVVLVEKGDLAAGSSGRSGAILRTMYASRTLAAMARDSLREYSGFMTRVGRTLGFRKTGVLTLAGPAAPEWLPRIAENVRMMLSLGIEVELLDAPALRDLVPGIEVEAGTTGAWEPEAGFVDPTLTVQAFAALARTHGAVTRLGVEAQRLSIVDGRVRGVETSEGVYEAELVVLAAGAWTRELLAREGVELPLSAVRPENHFMSMPGAGDGDFRPEPPESIFSLDDHLEKFEERFEEPSTAGSNHPVIIDLEHGYYTRCEPQLGRTRIGHVDYEQDPPVEDPDELGENVSGELASWARDVLERRMPAYREQEDVGSLVGLYTLTPDAQALIGPVPGVEGLWVVTGFSGHGFKLAPSVGLGVSQMVNGEPVSAFDPEAFDPQRFEGGGRSEERRAFGL